jgi:hypothetical protein
MFTGLPPFTLLHVVISLIGIASGFVVLFGLIAAKRLDGWTAIFLASTVLTSATGFFLPAPHFLPSHAVGILSLIALGVAIPARYLYMLKGAWRPAYVISALIALYLNVFVLIIQMFLKVEALRLLAPTQTEAPFVVAQSSALLLFVIFIFAANRNFRGQSLRTA